MSTFKDVKFTPGQCILDTDLHAMQRAMRSQILDMGLLTFGAFLGGQGGLDYNGAANDRRSFVWSMGDAGGCYASASALTVKVVPGPIFQWVGLSAAFKPVDSSIATAAPSLGEDPYALAYWVENGELDTVHAVGDGTNPRWDLVCVKLSNVDGDSASRAVKDPSSGVILAQTVNTRRNVTLTKAVVQGTPAGVPVLPALPAGYVPLYAVKVPTAYNAAFVAATHMMDMRMPLGAFSVDMWAVDYNKSEHHVSPGTLVYTTAGGFVYVSSNNVGWKWYAFPKGNTPANSARLTGIQIYGGGSHTAADFTLGYVSGAAFAGALYGPGNLVIDQTQFRAINTAGSAKELRGWTAPTDLANAHITSAPAWINGSTCPVGARPEQEVLGTDNIWKRIAMEWLPANIGSHCSFVRMHFAGGL